MADAYRDKDLELDSRHSDDEHAVLMPAGEQSNGRPSVSANGPATLISALLRWPMAAMREIGRTAGRPRPADAGTDRGFLSKVLGYPPPKHDPARETAWLDGLRGIAAFLVMAYHYNLDTFMMSTEAPYGDPGTQWLDFWRLPFFRVFWCSGHTQVGVFFVLSGFVLSWGGLAAIRSGRTEKFAQSLGSATFRRWLRLFMPCWLVGILGLFQYRFGMAATALLDMKPTFLGQVWDYVVESERFANPWALERNNWEVLNRYNPTMWTIPLEWAGSLLVFLTLLGVCRIRNYWRRTMIVAAIAGYACIRARWEHWLFASGILLADHVRQAGGFEQLSTNLSTRARMFWIGILILGALGAGIPENSPFFQRPGYEWMDAWIPHAWKDVEGGTRYWWCWAGIFLISGISHLATMRRIFERPFPRYLGRISFMLYLTHRQVGEVVGGPLRKWMGGQLGPKVVDGLAQARTPSQNILTMLFIYVFMWVVLAPLAFTLANWLEILVDAPCVRFAKRMDVFFTGGAVSDVDRPAEELARLPR